MPSESTDGIQQSLSNEPLVNSNNNGKSDDKSKSDGIKCKESQLHDDIIPLGLSINEINDKEDEKITSCGWIGIRPKWLQKYRTPRWLLFWLCLAGALQVCNNTLKELNF
jgi:hypothetical protein